jgi:hypothetical protein
MAIAGAVVATSLLASLIAGPARTAALVVLCAAFAAMVIADFADSGARAILGVVAIGTAVALTGISGSLIPIAAIFGVGILASLRPTERI